MQKIKFIASSSTLLKALQSIGGVLNSTNTLPILDNFLIEVGKDELTATASDLETTISITIGLDKGCDDYRIAIPAKLLLEGLKSFPEQPLTFTINPDNLNIEISTDCGRYKMVGQHGDEYPKTPAMEGHSTIEIQGDALSQAIGSTIFAVGNDELRPIMSGIFCEIDNNGTVFVATDAHRLVTYTDRTITAREKASFLVSKKPYSIVQKLVTGLDSVTVEYSSNFVAFTFGNFYCVTRQIDGKYPNYLGVIPDTVHNEVAVGRFELIACLKRVAIFSDSQTKLIRFKLQGSELGVSAEDVDFAKSADERMTVSHDGEDLEIGFNAKYMMDALTNLDSTDVSIKMSNPKTGIMITPHHADASNVEVLMLVMPTMLNK